jgi:hypothetical protein
LIPPAICLVIRLTSAPTDLTALTATAWAIMFPILVTLFTSFLSSSYEFSDS